MQIRKHQLTLRVLIAGLMLAALVFVQGCETESDDIPTGPAITIEGMISSGWENLNNGNFNDALFEFREAANADASNLEAYLGLGYAYAKAQEPISAQRNLTNVISLGLVMLDNGELSQEGADTLFAEACAGKASVALSTQDYAMAIDEAQLARDYWADFATPSHRWLPNFTLDHVMLLEANAWYGQSDYGEAFNLVDEINDGGFVTELINSNNLMFEEDVTVAVTLLQETQSTGVAQLDLDHSNLVYPVSVMKGNTSYTITGYDVVGNAVRFMANPIPVQGDEFVVTYYYAIDFGQFLIQLQEKLTE